jgi:HAD superfamily hydrolase (TIGR01549 family)
METKNKIKAVVFDVGETLVDETRMWRQWAAYLGVPESAVLAALDTVIARRGHHHEALRSFRPGLDIKTAYAEQAETGGRVIFAKDDLYPDALPCLSALRDRGYRIGIAGNQPAEAEDSLRECGFTADFVASSARWGVEKPSPVFFAKVRQAAGVDAAALAYVGDRLDNDVGPAQAAGMTGIFIERGPWGRIHATWPEAAAVDFKIHGLMEIPGILNRGGV